MHNAGDNILLVFAGYDVLSVTANDANLYRVRGRCRCVDALS
jgi:hypothetical protein